MSFLPEKITSKLSDLIHEHRELFSNLTYILGHIVSFITLLLSLALEMILVYKISNSIELASLFMFVMMFPTAGLVHKTLIKKGLNYINQKTAQNAAAKIQGSHFAEAYSYGSSLPQKFTPYAQAEATSTQQ